MTAERIEATARTLAEAAANFGFFVTGDGRLSEADAAALLGLHKGSLKNLRHEGAAPPSYRAGLNGCRVSYRLDDLAAWVESKREEF